MNIRVASADDAREIARVHIAGWRAAYRGHMPDKVLDRLDLEQRAAQWRSWLSSSSVSCLVIEAPRIVGFCSTVMSAVAPAVASAASETHEDQPKTAEISAIYIDPNFWRQGLGRELLTAASAHAAESGFHRLNLWVLRENPRARLFYESMGFSLNGRERTDQSLVGTLLVEVSYGLALGTSAEK